MEMAKIDYIKTDCFKRGDVYLANLGNTEGSIQGGTRPVVIIQNNMGNRFSPTLIIAPLTSRMTKKNIPTHVKIKNKLAKESIVLLEQIRTINKSELKNYITTLDENNIKDINKAICVSLGMN